MEYWNPATKTEELCLKPQTMEQEPQKQFHMGSKRKFAATERDETGVNRVKRSRHHPATRTGSKKRNSKNPSCCTDYRFWRPYKTLCQQMKRRTAFYLHRRKSDDVTRIYTEQVIERASEPKLCAEKGIQLTDMILSAKINGCQASMYVDSGTDSNFMDLASLHKFHFNTNLNWAISKVMTVHGRYDCLFATTRGQEIELDNGRKLVGDFDLTPSLDPNIFENYDAFFGFKLLIKYGCLQKFQNDGTSTLYFRDKTYPVGKEKEFGVKGNLISQTKGRPLSILLDTGAKNTLVSRRFMKEIETNSDAARSSSKKIVLTNQEGVQFQFLDVVVCESPGADISIGLKFLYSYEAIVDYHKRFLYLSTEGKTYRTKLFDLSYLFTP